MRAGPPVPQPMSRTRLVLPRRRYPPSRRIVSGLSGFWISWSRSTISLGQYTTATLLGRPASARLNPSAAYDHRSQVPEAESVVELETQVINGIDIAELAEY